MTLPETGIKTMAKIERAAITKQREFPEWLHQAIQEERSGLAKITDPIRRRLQELEIDQIETRVRDEIEGVQRA